ncbi:C-type lectin domain family 4 member F-like [Ruditapes philippinarum]|uniref:C-type lectin domain family 4 member F-like n=1 Tax=Ruditapes philippinarum TaxID=129788 RepID=UPI00295AFB61|nr:C-type lectin domain family 4 member F-like [Ruditapes philippinarum]
MVYLLIWICVIGIYIQTPECCEDKWVAYDRLGVCYRLYTTPRLEWVDAKDFCSKQDAELTDLYDYTEQMFVKDNLVRRIRAHGVWIGISDDGDEGDWRWVNNSRANIDRFEWWPGNPDNANVEDGFFDSFFGEDCVEISLKSKYRGQLNDYSCDERMPFICKKKGKPGKLSIRQTSRSYLLPVCLFVSFYAFSQQYFSHISG